MELMKKKLMSGRKDDKRVAMLKSIKPYLSEKRQDSVDSISQVLGMLSMMEGMQKKGTVKKKSKSKSNSKSKKTGEQK